MAEESVPQTEISKNSNSWWVFIPGALLVVPNITFVLAQIVQVYADYFNLVLHWNLDIVETESQAALYLQWLLPCLLIFLLIGIIRGRIAGNIRSAMFASILICLAGALVGFILLPLALSVIIGGEIGLSFLIAIAESPLWSGIQLVLAAVGGAGGGLIGSRLLHQRPRPAKAREPSRP